MHHIYYEIQKLPIMPEVEQHDDDEDHTRDQDDPKTSEDSQKYCPDITELIFFLEILR